MSLDFLKTFEEIDVDYCGEITYDEISSYMRRHNFDGDFVDKWLRLFEPNKDGRVTIESYCGALGLIPREHYYGRVVANRKAGTLISKGNKDEDWANVRIIRLEPMMDESMKTFIIRLARKAQKEVNTEYEMARFIKQSLDLRWGGLWQVIVSRYPYACYLSHEMASLIHFWLLDHSFCMWKTPDLVDDDIPNAIFLT